MPLPLVLLLIPALSVAPSCSAADDGQELSEGGSAFSDTHALADAGEPGDGEDGGPSASTAGRGTDGEGDICDDLECDDGNPCTNDVCNPNSGCEFTPTSVACDDGDPCTVGDNCLQGDCVGVPEEACDCSNDADCEEQDDGDPCTGVMVCVDSQCVLEEGSVVTCPPSTEACIVSVCDPETGGCVDSPILFGQACDDGDACTEGDACLQGLCEPGDATVCDDGNPCTADACEPATGCVSPPGPDGPCDDGDLCTTGDACVAGECTGSTTECDDGDPCTGDEACDAGTGECATTFLDADEDDVADACDACEGHDDSIDLDGNGIPDGCDDPGAPPSAPTNATFTSCGDFLCCAGDGVDITWDAAPGATHYRVSWVCGFAMVNSGDVTGTSIEGILGPPHDVANCNPVGNFMIKACKGAACSTAVPVALPPFTCGGGCCAF